MLNHAPSLDSMFQALGDPSRRVMVEQLSRGPATVSALAEPLQMSLPAVMRHLQVLESSGLVRSEKSGRVRTCQLETAALQTAEGWLSRQRQFWEDRLDRLDALLLEQQAKGRRTKR